MHALCPEVLGEGVNSRAGPLDVYATRGGVVFAPHENFWELALTLLLAIRGQGYCLLIYFLKHVAPFCELSLLCRVLTWG